jgi:hypothetical protein
MRRPRYGYFLSLPERLVRALAASVGGAVDETAQVLLPRLVRRSRFYEATAKNLLRVTIELVGSVVQPAARPNRPPEIGEPSTDDLEVKQLAVRKGAGNAVELGSFAAFGFSPLWLLAAASDVLHGSRVYLRALVDELKRARVLAAEAEIDSLDELLGVLERGTGRARPS